MVCKDKKGGGIPVNPYKLNYRVYLVDPGESLRIAMMMGSSGQMTFSFHQKVILIIFN